MGMIPMMPNLSVMRSFRVLRPLRSISRLPGLQKIIRSLVDSIGDLANVMLLLTFFLAVFSIVGVQFWKGVLHTRCRLTPFPVEMQNDCRDIAEPCWQQYISDIVMDPEAYRCLPDANDDASWTQSTSPWFVKGPKDCIWPIDTDDERVCSLSGNGYHMCPSVVTLDGSLLERTCGSNFDRFGNPRFKDFPEPYGFPRMKNGVFIEGLNWGFTNYDNFLSAFVTTFQVVSMEGWTDVMYQIIDAWAIVPAILVFVITIIFGGYIVLNLVLAVITGSLDAMEDEQREEKIGKEQENEKNPQLPSNQDVCQPENTRCLRELVGSRHHSNFIMLCIVLNTIILSLDHYGISDEMMNVMEITNIIFTVIFLIDMVACTAAYGVKEYWRWVPGLVNLLSLAYYFFAIARVNLLTLFFLILHPICFYSNPFTCFDGCIAIISVCELALMFFHTAMSDGPSSFSVFRSLRLFRIFKMARRWKSLQNLLRTMTETVQLIGNFAIFLLLFIFIYSLIGMQLFANRMHFHPATGLAVHISDEEYNTSLVPRSHFDNLITAMTTVFQLLSGENWNSVMYDGWRATSWTAVIYFLSLVMFGCFIVMNLFLAILLKSFDNNDVWVDEARIEKLYKHRQSRMDTFLRRSTITWQRGITVIGNKMGKAKCIRSCCSRLVHSQRFEAAVTVLILLSSICLAMDNPLANPESKLAKTLHHLDLAFTIVFIAEMAVKIIAYGFIFKKGAYLRNAWNVLDSAVVFVSVLNIANIGPGKVLRVLRILRVLRPLRMVNRLPELKLVVDALLLSFPSVANVAVLCGLFFLIFASFGVNFLKGTLYHCDGERFQLLSADLVAYLTYPREWGSLNSKEQSWFDLDSTSCMASDWDPLTIPSSKEVCNCLVPGEWVEVIPQNFNNVLNGMALLFEISTTEGWVDVMYAAVDQRGIEAQPVRDNNMLWAAFFVVFLIIGAFFVLELFVGVTINNFNKIRDSTGRGLMTEAQKEWATTQAFVMKIKPERRIQRPTGNLRSWCYDFIMPGTNPKFEQTITFCIFGNSLCAAVVTLGDSERKTTIQEAFNSTFAAIFILEVLIKITALNARYFNDGWNKFDFGIVCGSTIGLLLSAFIPDMSNVTDFIRIFRICRLLRLIKSIRSLRALFNTMITSIPSIANIGSLLLLIFFMYAVGGVQLYSFIPDNGDVNQQANFRSFGNTMLLLLRFSTGENWNGFMRSMLVEVENCDPEPLFDASETWCLSSNDYPSCTEINGCAAGSSVFVYFYSFTLLVSFVVVNLFVGIVLEAFEKSNEGDILSPSDLENFTRLWAECKCS